MNVPKPKYCGQDWLEMKKVPGGRICGHCTKKIVDFSKMSWAEIEAIQRSNNNSVCGMYNPKQLDHWGREIPKKKNTFIGAAAFGAISLFGSVGLAQSNSDTANYVVVTGQLIDKETKEPIPFASVLLTQSNNHTQSNFDGEFKIVVDSISPEDKVFDILQIGLISYEPISYHIHDLNSLRSKAPLKFEMSQKNNVIAFYVPAPTRKEKFKAKIKKVFGRKNKED